MSEYIIQDGELYHYGVLGMKWGKRKAAKQEYRQAKNQAFAKYEKTIADIEKPYKRGQNLSAKDIAREADAERTYNEEVAKAKAKFQSSKQTKTKETDVNTNKKRMSTGKKVALGVLATMGVVAVSDVALNFKERKDEAVVLSTILRFATTPMSKLYDMSKLKD